MIDSKSVKEIIIGLGADLCGIAPVDRFKDAPEGFHPKDIYKNSKSIVVFAKRLPIESLFATSCVPYTYVNNIITQKIDELGFEVALKLEDQGTKAVPIPSDDPYEYWEPENKYGRAILSLRHAGYLAGLGVLGKNTLLINKQFGNMIQIGALLVPIELEGDEIATYKGCPSDCNICVESCPVNALEGETVNQKLCRPISNFRTEKGYILKKCNECRKVCPLFKGIK